jgi:glycosyltransferase involved in cell wall biosynthesis
MRIVCFGTYDLDKPRNRLMIAALRGLGHDVTEIHAPVWDGVPDKSQVRGPLAKLRLGLRWLAAYPGLIRRWRYHVRTHGAPDLAVVGYLGHLDVLVLRRLARDTPIVWDAFLSIYDTVVRDRAMVGPRHPAARLLFAWERAACRAATCVVLDTPSHGAMFADLYGLDPDRLASVPVGAELDAFPRQPPRPAPPPARRPRVLFYGQFIPLHGIDTIIAAARTAPDLDWQIIGTGQAAAAIRAGLDADPIDHLTWTDWVDYPRLIDHIAEADVCLGIFGQSEKAARVIPNKVYQIIASGRPLVTRDGPAARDFFGPDPVPGVRLVPPGDAAALATAARDLAAAGETPPASLTDRFDAAALRQALDRVVTETHAAAMPRPRR